MEGCGGIRDTYCNLRYGLDKCFYIKIIDVKLGLLSVLSMRKWSWYDFLLSQQVIFCYNNMIVDVSTKSLRTIF